MRGFVRYKTLSPLLQISQRNLYIIGGVAKKKYRRRYNQEKQVSHCLSRKNR